MQNIDTTPATDKPKKVKKRTGGSFKKDDPRINRKGNPSKQLFGFRDPAKQALMRAIIERQEKKPLSPDDLAKAAEALLDKAINPKHPENMQAINSLFTKLDGPPQAAEGTAPPNTYQIVLQNITSLNLTPELREQYKRNAIARIEAAGTGGAGGSEG